MAKRLVIAIDCDDVLIGASEYLVETYNRTYGTSVQLQNAYVSGNTEWQADRDEVLRRIYAIQMTDDYAAIEPEDGTIKAVKQLASDHELHLVTARDSTVMLVTQQMVDTYFPGCFASIEHVGADASKGDICARIGAKVMIDDNVGHLETASENGVGLLIWFGKYAWQEVQKERAQSLIGLRSCHNWQDVVGVVSDYARR
jgi:5'(3')-deoxyribonucleotidase